MIGDLSVTVGAGMATLGGTLLVVSALGIAATLSASGVGTVAGLLIAAGVIIIMLTTDDEWETFCKHCYFAKKDGDYRNARPSGKGSDHWFGETNIFNHSRHFKIWNFNHTDWGVKEQIASLIRLMSRFSVSSLASAHNYCPDESSFKPGDSGEFTNPIDAVVGLKSRRWTSESEGVRWSAILVVDTQYVPPGSTLSIILQKRTDSYSALPDLVREEKWRADLFINLSSDQMFPDDEKRSVIECQGARVGCFAPPDRPGFILVAFEKEMQSEFFQTLRAHVSIKLPAGTRISCNHDLLSYGQLITRASSQNWMKASETTSFANTFSDARESSPAIGICEVE